MIHPVLGFPGPPSQPAKPCVSKVTTSSVKLKWPVPEYDGSSPILSYQVEILQDRFDEWQPIVQHPKNYFVVKTLEPNTTYRFRVIAYNEFGASKASEPSEAVSTKGRGRSLSGGSKSKTLGVPSIDGQGMHYMYAGFIYSGWGLGPLWELGCQLPTVYITLLKSPNKGLVYTLYEW